MDDEHITMKISELTARIARAEYDVDVDAVAEAFVVRVLTAHAALRHTDVWELLGDAGEDQRLPAA